MDYILNIGTFLASITVLIIIIMEKGHASKRYRMINERLQQLENKSDYLEKALDKLDTTLRDEMARSRGETTASMKSLSDSLISRINEMSKLQHMQSDSIDNRMAKLSDSNEQKLEAMRNSIEEKLKEIREDNSRKLEAMRATVDEKLQDTLEKRLGESFKIVSDRLEQVHRGLGEMQNLASGVGDLKKVLTNVKSRGIWGEIQLGNILEQILTPEQYFTNVAT